MSRITQAKAGILARSSIVVGLIDRENGRLRRRRGSDAAPTDVVRLPVPTEKPRPDAQWNEAAGDWEVWSEERQVWVSLDDGTVQTPGTPSVAPTEEAIERPTSIDPG